MALTWFVNYIAGLSSDSKPIVADGFMFYETDTGTTYNRMGGAWTQTQAGEPNIFSGVQSSRPNASENNGKLYIPTDSHYPSRSNGSSWNSCPMPGFKAGAPPTASSFTAVKDSGSATDTLVDDGDGLLFTSPGRNTSSLVGTAWLIALPSPPYTFVIGLEVLCFQPTNAVAFGAVLADGITTGAKQVMFGYVAYTNGVPYFVVEQFSSMSGYYGDYIYRREPMMRRLFLKIQDDNTNRICSFSRDGRNYYQYHSVGRTDFLTPTHVGIRSHQGTNPIDSSLTCVQARVFHWSLG